MGRTPWGVYCWPGLPLIWKQGSWFGLAMAVGFAALVNLALASSLLWSELLTSGLRTMVWTVVAVVWAASALLAYRWNAHRTSPQQSPPGDSFALALDHYLKGNWFEAEFLLSGILAKNPRDADAGLMLATLLRHTGRIDESVRQLDRLERLDDAQKWEWEIRRERELIDEARAQRAASHEAAVTAGPASEPADVREAA
jgi:hypothetical protein